MYKNYGIKIELIIYLTSLYINAVTSEPTIETFTITCLKDPCDEAKSTSNQGDTENGSADKGSKEISNDNEKNPISKEQNKDETSSPSKKEMVEQNGSNEAKEEKNEKNNLQTSQNKNTKEKDPKDSKHPKKESDDKSSKIDEKEEKMPFIATYDSGNDSKTKKLSLEDVEAFIETNVEVELGRLKTLGYLFLTPIYFGLSIKKEEGTIKSLLAIESFKKDDKLKIIFTIGSKSITVAYNNNSKDFVFKGDIDVNLTTLRQTIENTTGETDTDTKKPEIEASAENPEAKDKSK